MDEPIDLQRRGLFRRWRQMRRLSLPLAIFFALVAVQVAVAAATFSGSSGPIYQNPGYLLTATVMSMSLPQQHVCLNYTVNGVPQTAIDCTCTASACDSATGVGTWECLIPTDYINATIDWDISAYPGGSCSGTIAQGPTGSFGTGPTAAGLTVISAGAGTGRVLLGLTMLAVLLAVTLAATRRARERKSKLPA